MSSLLSISLQFTFSQGSSQYRVVRLSVCISACLRLLCVLIADEIWWPHAPHKDRESKSENTSEDERGRDRQHGEELEKNSDKGDNACHNVITNATVEAIVDLCNVLDGQYSNRDEIVRTLRSQGQVTLSLLLQVSPSARSFFMKSKECSESDEKVNTIFKSNDCVRYLLHLLERTSTPTRNLFGFLLPVHDSHSLLVSISKEPFSVRSNSHQSLPFLPFFLLFFASPLPSLSYLHTLSLSPYPLLSSPPYLPSFPPSYHIFLPSSLL